MKKYAIKSNVSGAYWNEKKGGWSIYKSDPDIWYTKEELEKIQKFYAIDGIVYNETIIEKEF